MRRPLRPLPEAERLARLADRPVPLAGDLLPLNLTPEERKAAMEPGLPAPAVPQSSGFATSEGKLTVVAMAIGFILESVAVPLLTTFQASHPGAVWVPIVLAVAGALIQVAALFGYQKSRTALKVASLESKQ